MPALRGIFAASASLLIALAGIAAGASAGLAAAPSPWPVSSGLVVAEVVTGGASASDEYIEIYNAGAGPADTGACQVVYVSASGATVTRKITLPSPLSMAAGQHLLIANAAGIYAPLADFTYTGGLAADGGSIVLETPGGAVIDAVGWGTASNAYSEGAAAPAPPARSSIERLPGGALGNGRDTNDNHADWAMQTNPIPQPMSAEPVPGPNPVATPTATESAPDPTTVPTQSPTASPAAVATDPTATATATAGNTAAPTVSPTADPTAAATATPKVPATTPTASYSAPPTTSPSGDPTSGPTSPSPAPPTSGHTSPSPVPPTSESTTSPSAPPTAESIAEARLAADGATVTVDGVVTASIGTLESGHGGFIQDSSAGVAVYLDSAATPIAAGSLVRATGTIGDRYGQRTVRIDGSAGGSGSSSIVVLGVGALPAPTVRTTGAIAEADEGRLVVSVGTVTAAPDDLSDGTGLWLDDGSGPLRVIVTAEALADVVPVRGMRLAVVGPIGRHAAGSSTGYRLEATEPGDVVVIVDAGPTPSAGSSPTASRSPVPDSSATLSATPSPSPSSGDPGIDVVSISAARSLAVGSKVRIAGVVTAGSGVLGADGLVALADSSGGIFVRLASPLSTVIPGRSVEIVGGLAAPYGQLEIRDLTWIAIGDLGGPRAPVAVSMAQIGESTEGSLVRIRGSVDSVRLDSGRLTLTIGSGTAAARVLADPPAGLIRADVTLGAIVDVTGIVGQRASSNGALDGYRVWLRTRSDFGPVAAAPTETGSAVSPSAVPTSSPHSDLASAISTRNARVDVRATVTAQNGLLDIDGPTIVVDDGTAAVAVVLPDDAARPPVGARVRVIGTVGTWHGGPKVVATRVEQLGELGSVTAEQSNGVINAAQEWHLVRICGRIDTVTRAGSRWRVELVVDGRRVVVLGEPAAGIPASRMVKGGLASVTGIVRRSSSDSSAFQVLPRASGDVRVAIPPAAAAPAASSQAGSGAGASGLVGSAGLTTIADLATNVSRTVVVAGLVTEADGRTATLDDGTGSVVLGGSEAAESLAIIEPGDALEVTGVVQSGPDGLTLIVDPTGIVTLDGLSGESEPDDIQPVTGGASAVLGGAGRSAGGVDLAGAASPEGAIGGSASLHLGSSGSPNQSPWPLLAIGALAVLMLMAAAARAVLTRRSVSDDQRRHPRVEGVEHRRLPRAAAEFVRKLRRRAVASASAIVQVGPDESR